MELVRKGEAEVFYPHGKDIAKGEILFGPDNGSANCTFHLTSLYAEKENNEEEIHESSDQVFYVLEGRVDVFSDGDKVATLEKGDGVHILAGESHAIQNCGDRTSRLLVLTVPPL